METISRITDYYLEGDLDGLERNLERLCVQFEQVHDSMDDLLNDAKKIGRSKVKQLKTSLHCIADIYFRFQNTVKSWGYGLVDLDWVRRRKQAKDTTPRDPHSKEAESHTRMIQEVEQPSEITYPGATRMVREVEQHSEITHPGATFYESLPTPWNIAPHTQYQKSYDFGKNFMIENFPTFNGTLKSYRRWRQAFLQHVHPVYAPVNSKVQLIINTLNRNDPFLDTLVNGLEGTLSHYRTAIHTLEKTYGDASKLMVESMEALQSRPPVRLGNHTDLLSLLSDLNSTRNTFQDMGNLESFNQPIMQSTVVNLLPFDYQMKYDDYTRDVVRAPPNMENLIQYLGRLSDQLCSSFTKPKKRARSRSYAKGPKTLASEFPTLRLFCEREINTDAKGTDPAHAGSLTKVSSLDENDNLTTPLPGHNLNQEGLTKVSPLGQSYSRLGQLNVLNPLPESWADASRSNEEDSRPASPAEIADVINHNGDSDNSSELDLSAYMSRDNLDCELCPGKRHSRDVCPLFLLMDVPHRKDSLTLDDRCFACFKQGHRSGHCKLRTVCDICRKGHHTLVCNAGEDSVDPAKVTTPRNRSPARLPIVGVILENPDTHKRVNTNALLDSGAQRTFIADHLRTTLALAGHAEPYHSVGFGGVRTTFEYSVACTLRTYNLNRTSHLLMKVSTLPDPVGELFPSDFSNDIMRHKELRELQIAGTFAGVKVDMVIGIDNSTAFKSSEPDVTIPHGPMAKHTMFGYVLMGPASLSELRAHVALESQERHAKLYAKDPFFVRSYLVGDEDIPTDVGDPKPQYLRSHKAYDKSLLDLVQKLHDLNDLGDDVPMTLEDQHAYTKLKETIRWAGQRYEAGCLWKRGEPCLPNNRNAAIRRFLQMEKKTTASSALASTYEKTISDYLKKGYVIQINDEKEVGSPSFYLPHFVVTKATDDGIKHRIVFDGAARFMNKSLNDATTKGPNFIADLVKVLLRFRKSPVAITFDISEMFLQVQLREEDQRYHRFVYHSSPDDPLITFQFTRHVFGNTGSPCVAMSVVRAKAAELSKELPLASRIVMENSIIDDTMTSVDTPKEALTLYEGVKKIYHGCSMVPHKIASNSREVLDNIPNTEKAKGFHTEDFLTNVSPSTTTLGMLWLSFSDVYTYRAMRVPDDVCTMRQILKYTASLFDPLGLLAPYIIRARLIVQRCCKAKLTWDEKVPTDILSDWNDWKNELRVLPDFMVERCLRSDRNSLTIHSFCDASELAFAVCIYAVSGNKTTLVYAKARVSPSPAQSIPRLELCAAKLAATSSLFVTEALNIPKEDVFLWSDSKCTLDWIASDDKVLLPFVGNRVRSIRAIFSPSQWRYVPTDLNPADLASRGGKLDEISRSNLWLHGPTFLTLKTHLWPPPHGLGKVTEEALAEVKKGENLVITPCESGGIHNQNVSLDKPLELGLILRFNSLKKATMSMAFVFAFIDKLRSPKEQRKARRLVRSKPLIKPSEFLRAESHLISRLQKHLLPEEYNIILVKKQLPPSSPLFRLNLFVDSYKVLRVHSRLSANKDLEYDMRYPIFVPKKSALAKAIFWDYHVDTLHSAGANQTLSDISTRFHTQGGREFFKSLIRSCFRCKILRPKRAPQLLAPLPAFRSTSSKPAPFATTTLDAAGPFIIKQNRGQKRVSRHLLLFTCAITRATHIEVMFTTDTDSFLLALARFASSRGRPSRIVCDNAGQFRAASSALDTSLNNPDLMSRLQSKYPSINFEFIPARSPHVNGVTERMIQSMKRALKHVITPGLLREDELLTSAKLAEGILNSRPLTYTSSNPNDLRPLTPGHFLAGSALSDLSPIPLSTSLAKRYNLVQKTLDNAWARYQKEILPQLRIVNKWLTRRSNLSVNDVVIIMDDNERGSFPLGKIIDVHPNDEDGVVRSISVKVGPNTWRRHANGLLLLVPAETHANP
jgi:hypothetical protein